MQEPPCPTQRLGYDRYVIKAEWGTAGRAAIRVAGLSTSQDKWLQRMLRQQGKVVIEPELEKCIDYSIQISIKERIQVVDVGRFVTDKKGQYLGPWRGPVHRGLDRSLLRFIHQDGKDPKWLQRIIQRTAQLVGEALRNVGYRGPAGIDAMIYRHNNQYKVRPIVEVNPRFTMGRIGYEISKHVFPGQTAFFGILPPAKIELSPMFYKDKRFYQGQILLTSSQYPVAAYLSVGLVPSQSEIESE